MGRVREASVRMLRTTVVGNYPRVGDTPEEQRLRRAVARWEKGELTEEERRRVEVDVVQEVVREQASWGIDVVTDGQVTWYDSQSHFASGLDGLEATGLVRYFDTNTYYRRPRARGRVRWSGPITVDDWREASAASPVPVKSVLTGPYTLAALSANGADHAPEFVHQLADALGREVEALVAAGATHIQVDEPAFVRLRGLPEAYDGIADRVLAAKGDAETTLFTYFGGVAPLLDELLELPFDVVGLDLVQGAQTLEALRGQDTDTAIAFGLIDARNTKLEKPKDVANQVLSFADRVPLDRSYVAPSNGLEFLPRGKARAKLQVVVAAARAVREAM